MIATNHALAGTIIGGVTSLEYAIPAAIASHVILDVLPHYSIDPKKRDKSAVYRKIVFTDTTIALSIAAITALFGQWQMFWIGWIAYGPDGYWVYLYYKGGKSFNVNSDNWLAKIHHKIQVFERLWALPIDLAVAIFLFPIFILQLLN